MLQLVLGKAGTGKTILILDQIEKTIQQNKKAILIVPEQFSFESERTLFRRLGISNMKNVEVLSFTRLSQDIFRTCGGLAGRRLDQTVRYLIMNIALQEVSDTLEIYRRQSRQSSFISTLVEVVTEFKLAGTYPEDLKSIAAGLDNRFSKKLNEISVIYAAYQSILEGSFSDPHDDITKAAKLAAENQYFKDKHIFVDGFLYFSAAERQMLSGAISQAEEVWVSLCCDGLSEQENDTGIFISARRTAQKLINSAKKALVKVALPKVLDKPLRFEQNGIARIEQMLSTNCLPDVGDGSGVVIAAAPNPYAEAEYAAAAISDLVRSGMRYRDIVVIARNIEDYEQEIESAFSQYDIPFFADRNTPADIQPLSAALLGALELATNGFNTDTILKLAKCPALGLEIEDVSVLENYCFVWSVSGKDWLKPFSKNPNGVDNLVSSDIERKLARLNALREQLIGPLEKLDRRLKNCDGLGFAKACYSYFDEIKAADNIRAFAQQLAPAQSKSLLELSEALWQELMNTLDLFVLTLGERRINPERFTELVRLCVSSIDLGQIPRTLDEVICGSAARMISGSPKAAIVLGVNEGVFPAGISSGGIFTDSEISGLYDKGVEISQPAFELALGERYYLYTAMTAPSQHLIATYSTSSNSGSPMEPSLALKRVLSAIPDSFIHTALLDPVDLLANDATAFSLLASKSREDTPLRTTLHEYFCENGKEDLAARLGAAAKGARISPIEGDTAQKLFGEILYLSPSRLERYFSCPFEYFCKDGLKITPRRKAEFSPLESGTLIHLVLEKIVEKYGGRHLADLPAKVLEAEIEDIISQFLKDYAGDENELPARQRYLFKRLVGLLVRIIRRLGAEFAQSEFVPVGFEVEVSEKGEVKPLELCEGSKKIILEGKIDRIDVYDDGNNRYARVVDYKSGGKKLALSEIYEGLNIQMLIYLFSVCEGESGRFTGSMPAGVLYMPAKVEAVSMPRQAQESEIDSELNKGMKQNGLLLDDAEVLQAMEKGLAGQYIPVKMAANGIDKRSMLASSKQLGDIKRRLRELINQMADKLYFGDITPNPAVAGDRNPCEYCDYGRLCQNTDKAVCRSIVSMSPDEFFKAVDGGEQNGSTMD